MQVVSDSAVANEILSIIREARRYVVLVTPYVAVWERLVTDVRRAVERGVHVTVYVRYETGGGVPPLKQVHSARQLEEAGATLRAISRLHTKVYFNEASILMTSMNLVQSSAMNSLELGIRWKSAEHREESEAVYKHVHSLSEYEERLDTPHQKPSVSTRGARATPARNTSTAREKAQPSASPAGPQGARIASELMKGLAALVAETRRPPAESPSSKSGRRAKEKRAVVDDTGVCLRCEETIDYDPARPLCSDCYAVWRRYGDPDYVENFCHGCGKEHATSINRPLCYQCYRA